MISAGSGATALAALGPEQVSPTVDADGLRRRNAGGGMIETWGRTHHFCYGSFMEIYGKAMSIYNIYIYVCVCL